MTGSEKPKILVIVGPTASGKTSLSIKLAKKFDGEVISADSRQVYKRLDIGTEKVTKEEMKEVPHHLIDVVDVDTIYSASDYKKAASHAIKKITGNGHVPIVAGGTFFYIDTLLGKIQAPEVAPDIELRAELEKMDVDVLYTTLLKLDPRRASDLDPQNKRRLIRALEIVKSVGIVPELPAAESVYDVLTIGIQLDRTELRTRIRARAEEALTKGLVEETKTLLESGVDKERLMEIGLEYRLILEYLDGDLNDAELIQKIEEKNWQYAKRQLTWLKRDGSIKWFERDNIDGVLEVVEEFLEGKEVRT